MNIETRTNNKKHYATPPRKKSGKKQRSSGFASTETEFIVAESLDGTLWVVVDTEPHKKGAGSSRRWHIDRACANGQVVVQTQTFGSRIAAIKAAKCLADEYNSVLRENADVANVSANNTLVS